MKKKVFVKCEPCEGLGVHYGKPFARTCETCNGKRGWMVDPQFLKEHERTKTALDILRTTS